MTIRIRYNIEPTWTRDSYEGEVTFDDDELEGLSAFERTSVIEDAITDAVSQDCPWGWEELSE